MVLKEGSVKNANDLNGVKILVTRYWPRGHKKETFDHWLRELAPSFELYRDWKKGKMAWEEYEMRFKEEKLGNPEVIKKMREIKQLSEKTDVFLLCNETEHPCHRFILMELMRKL